VKVSVVVPFTRMACVPKALMIVGGPIAASASVSVALLSAIAASTAVPGAKMVAVFTSVPVAFGETEHAAV
jgi:hypothetical protein